MIQTATCNESQGPDVGRDPIDEKRENEILQKTHQLVQKLARIYVIRRAPYLDSDDVAQEVMINLFERYSHRAWRVLLPENFATPEYEEAKEFLFRSIRSVTDRNRRRLRLEDKSSCTNDVTKATGKRRQRRWLPHDVELGDQAAYLMDSRTDRDVQDMILDLASVMDQLRPIERDIISRRVEGERSWKEIGRFHGKDGAFARRVFATAIDKLSQALRFY